MQTYINLKPTDPTGLSGAVKRWEACIAQVQQWITYNQVRLNSFKAEFLVVVSPPLQFLVDITKPLLKVGKAVIFPSTFVPNLGVILDAHNDVMRQRATSIVTSASTHLRSRGPPRLQRPEHSLYHG